MQTETESAPWKKFQELADQSDAEHLQEEAELLGTRESSRALSRLSPEAQAKVLTLIDPERVAHFLDELSETQAAELLTQITAEEAATIVAEMDTGVAADVLAALDEELVDEIFAALEPAAAQSLRMLKDYPADTAGGIMITEYLAFPETDTTRGVIEDLRRHTDTYHEYAVQYTYVVSKKGRLLGVLPLRTLLLTPGEVPITEVMIADLVSVQATATLEELDEFFTAHTFLAVPVVNERGRLVGVVERERLEEAFGKQAEDDYRKTQGIVGGDELRSMALTRRSGRRLSWLSVNILLNIVAASVIAFFTDTLEAVIALAVFIPIISDMSGCSGNQAVAVSMRELSLGLVKPIDLLYVWRKEIAVGMINGLCLGALIGLAAWLWKGNPYLGAVVGFALCLNTMVAVSLGGLLPLTLKRFGVDPALASGPILTTVTDMCGFFLILGTATLFLVYLV